MSGCATIFSGTEQDLKVLPADAKLEIYSWNGKLLETPKIESNSTMTVHRPKAASSNLIRLQKEGYCPRYWLTTPKANPPTYLNWIIGGVIGFMIDMSTGAGRAYSPTEFQLNIPETQLCG